MHPHVIVMGESTVLLNVISKLTEQCHACSKVGHISRVFHKRQQNASRGHGHTTNLIENQATETDTSSQNTECTLLPVKSQVATPP